MMPLGCRQHGLPVLFAFAGASISEPFGEWVVIDFQLGNLFILVGGNCDEFRLFEDVSAERAVRELEDVVGAYEMKSRLVLVHRVQYREAVFVGDVVG